VQPHLNLVDYLAEDFLKTLGERERTILLFIHQLCKGGCCDMLSYVLLDAPVEDVSSDISNKIVSSAIVIYKCYCVIMNSLIIKIGIMQASKRELRLLRPISSIPQPIGVLLIIRAAALAHHQGKLLRYIVNHYLLSAISICEDYGTHGLPHRSESNRRPSFIQHIFVELGKLKNGGILLRSARAM
jgi:hypothetical protein